MNKNVANLAILYYPVYIRMNTTCRMNTPRLMEKTNNSAQ